MAKSREVIREYGLGMLDVGEVVNLVTNSCYPCENSVNFAN